MDIGISARLRPILDEVKGFVETGILPLEHEFLAEIDTGDRWAFTPRQIEILEGLKARHARAACGTSSSPSTTGARAHERGLRVHRRETGKSHLAPEVFNCARRIPATWRCWSATARGAEGAVAAAAARGEIRSAFAMTEPACASSDATNISMSAGLEGDEWVLNGEKWWTSGIGDPRCKILIVMVRTSPTRRATRGTRRSWCRWNARASKMLRMMQVFGHDDAPHGHMHMRFTNVRVPKDNIILGSGRGFEIAQGRLGPGRIHHCMRAIGMAERALELMCRRALSRAAFGKPLAKLGGNYDIIADAAWRSRWRGCCA